MGECVVCGGQIIEHYSVQSQSNGAQTTSSLGWGCSICGLSYKKLPIPAAVEIQMKFKAEQEKQAEASNRITEFSRLFNSLPDQRKDG